MTGGGRGSDDRSQTGGFTAHTTQYCLHTHTTLDRALPTADETADCLPGFFTDELSSYLTSLASVFSPLKLEFGPRLL